MKRKFNEQEDKQKIMLTEVSVKQAANMEQQITRAVTKINEALTEVKASIQEA